jgi:hypothetical protein
MYSEETIKKAEKAAKDHFPIKDREAKKLVKQIADYVTENPIEDMTESAHGVLRHLMAHELKRTSHPQGLPDFFLSAMVESDRGFVIAVASVIDKEIESLLKTHFTSCSQESSKDIQFLFHGGSMPPLQSTAMKITFAFVLGLIDKPLRIGLGALQSLRSQEAAHARESFVLKEARVKKLYGTFSGDLKDRAQAVFKHRDPRFDEMLASMSPARAVFFLLALVMLEKLWEAQRACNRKRKRKSANPSGQHSAQSHSPSSKPPARQSPASGPTTS